MLIQAPMKHGRQQVHVADGKSDMDCCACLASTEPATGPDIILQRR